jgi:thiamine-phosphate pyrophosphorylase
MTGRFDGGPGVHFRRKDSSLDARLYLVTDRRLMLGRPIEDVVLSAVRGGVTAVQWREKTMADRDFLQLARSLAAVLKPLGIPLIINDRAEIAASCGAAGVHLGGRDIPVSEARRLLGPGAIIGLSVETMEQAEAAEAMDVDYLGVSPVFSTPTKTDAGPAWEIEGLRRLRARTRLPLIAIGGINASNAASVLRAGADGLAVVSAVCSAPDPEAAAREVRTIIDGGRGPGRRKKRARY